MADYRIPSPHTPIPPHIPHPEGSYASQKRTIRTQNIEMKIEELEEFICKSTADPKNFEKVFILLTNLRNIISFGLLDADHENSLINELTDFKDQLDGGNMKVGAIHEKLKTLMSHLEDLLPKVKVLNTIQELKNLFHHAPPEEVSRMEEKDFDEMVSSLISFLKEDIEKFQTDKLFKRLDAAHKLFLEHPRQNYSLVIEQIKQLSAEIANRSF